jgi:hypothetical protein
MMRTTTSPKTVLLSLLGAALLLAPLAACESSPARNGDPAARVEQAAAERPAPSLLREPRAPESVTAAEGISLREELTREPRDPQEHERQRLRSRLGARRELVRQPGGVALDREPRMSRREALQLSPDQRAGLDTLREHRHTLHRCYLDALERSPDLEGGVILRLHVEPDGSVSDVRATSDEIRETGLSDCLADRLKGIQFPATEAGFQLVHPMRFGSRERPAFE